MRAASTESGEVAGYIAGGETAMMPPPQVPYGQDFNQPQQSYSTPDPSAAQVTYRNKYLQYGTGGSSCIYRAFFFNKILHGYDFAKI